MLDACIRVIDPLPLTDKEKDARLDQCIDNWYHRSSKNRRQILERCQAQSKKEEQEACLGIHALYPKREFMPYIPQYLDEVQAQVKHCNAEAAKALSEEEAAEFKQWCVSLLPPKLRSVLPVWDDKEPSQTGISERESMPLDALTGVPDTLGVETEVADAVPSSRVMRTY
ncbi:MAG: hypothetical protein ACTSRC_18690, partial [Candidatus Helarchaeota archaeon]